MHVVIKSSHDHVAPREGRTDCTVGRFGFLFRFSASAKPQVALFRRSAKVRAYQLMHRPSPLFWREIKEETTLTPAHLDLFRQGKPYSFTDEGVGSHMDGPSVAFHLKDGRDESCIQLDWENEGWTWHDPLDVTDDESHNVWWRNARFAAWHLWKNGRESMGAAIFKSALLHSIARPARTYSEARAATIGSFAKSLSMIVQETDIPLDLRGWKSRPLFSTLCFSALTSSAGEGDVSNKTGSLPAVLSARHVSPGVQVVRAWDQGTDSDVKGQVAINNVYFEWVSSDLVTTYISEDGELTRGMVAEQA
ncbi:hypothetical protein EV126DRAFT_435668, partial [Verticillium dahliae]